MSTDDPRLEQALHDAAPPVASSGVVARIAQRRVRRRRNRRLGAGALVLVVLLAVGTVTALVTRDDDASSPHIAAPGAGLRARVVTGDGATGDGAGALVTPKHVVLDQDARLLRAPMVVGATALSVASYDPGPDGVALSHVVRIDGAQVRDIVDFKAHVLSIAEGEGARWALTQNLRTTGGKVPDAFLKRIPAAGDPVSVQLPLNADPVGPIAAVGGAVWVPVRDGVLQYDPSGQYVRSIALADASSRWVAQVGKLASVTDGDRLRSLDPSAGLGRDTTSAGDQIIGLAAAGFDSRMLLAAEGGGREHARVTRATTRTSETTTTLPDGFRATGLAASTTRLWATGTVDGSPAIVLLGDGGPRATVVLENADDGALVWTDAHTVRAVSGGELFDIAIP